MPSYHLSRDETWYPLKEKGTQNSPEPKVSVSPHMTLYQLPLHAV
jgi:hypothetical protein